MTTWRIRLFGGLSLEHEGQTVMAMRTRKDDLVLAYLALAPATTHVRTTVVAALWPRSESVRARKILSFNLFSLKGRLGGVGLEGAIEETRTTLRLSPTVTTDVQEFSDLVQRAAALGGDQADERSQLAHEALELYGEGLLPSYRYPWLDPHRNRVAGLYRQALMMKTGAPLGVIETPRTSIVGSGLPAGGSSGVGGRPLGAEEVDVAPPSRWRAGGVEDLLALCDQVAELEPLLSGADRWAAVQVADDLYRSRLREALSQTPSSGSIRPLLSIATDFWRYWYLRAHYAEGATTIDRLLFCGLSVQPALRAKALHASGTLAYFNGDHRRAIERLREAMRLWETIDDDEGLLRTLVNLGMSLYGVEEYEQAMGLYEQAIAIAGRLGNEAFLSTALYNASLAALRMEDAPKMRALLHRRLALDPAVLDASARATTHMQLAAAALIEDDDSEALEQANRAWRLVDESPDHRGRAVVLSLLGRCEQRAGHLDQAIDWYEQSMYEAKLSGDITQRAESSSYLAVAHAARGEQPLADRFSEQARQLYRLAGARAASRQFEQDLAVTREAGQRG